MPAAVYPLIVGSRDRRPGQLDGIVGLLISKELRTPIKAVGIPPPPVNPPNSCCIIIKAHDRPPLPAVGQAHLIVDCSRSVKAIVERVFINLRDENVVFTNSCNKNATFLNFYKQIQFLEFLASPGALEVILSLTYLLIVRTDLTDVTLVSDDTY